MDTHPTTGRELLPSTGFGQHLAAFVDQFAWWPPGPEHIPRLMITLHPALHDEHLRDVVHDLAFTNGVSDVRIVRAGPGAHLRAVLAGYLVRIIGRGDLNAARVPDAGDSEVEDVPPEPVVSLFDPVSKTVLVTMHPGPVTFDQSRVDLGELVAQALRHEAEEHGGVDFDDERSHADLGLRCETCASIHTPVYIGDTSPMCPHCGQERRYVIVAYRDEPDPAGVS